MNLTGSQIIAGTPSREGSNAFTAVDPRTGAALEPSFAAATEDEIDRAVRAAKTAHLAMKTLSREARAVALEGVAEAIEALGDPLLERASSETGLPLPRLTMERGRTMNQLRLFAKTVREGSYLGVRIDHGNPSRAPLPKPDLRRLLIPLGPVAVFGASNFPLAFSVAGGDTASALAAGCPVVVKGHPAHPGTSEMIGVAVAEALAAAGLPAGVFSLVQGNGTEVGLALVNHPDIQAVGFTGSLAGGRALFDAAAARRHPIPVFAEMGSTNPVFLMPDAIQARGPAIAVGLAQSVLLGVGQFCTNPGLLFAVAGPATDAFTAELKKLLDDAPEGTMLHDGIRAGFEDAVTRAEAITGVTRAGGSFAPHEDGAQAGCALLVTDARHFIDEDALSQEIFGPATVLVTCVSLPEMLEAARHLEGQLTATVHADETDDPHLGELIEILEERAGRLVLNGFPTGVEVCDAMHHGGPYPATTDSRTTSVGTAAILRFLRPLCYQDFPESLLPRELRDATPNLLRLTDGTWSSP